MDLSKNFFRELKPQGFDESGLTFAGIDFPNKYQGQKKL